MKNITLFTGGLTVLCAPSPVLPTIIIAGVDVISVIGTQLLEWMLSQLLEHNCSLSQILEHNCSNICDVMAGVWCYYLLFGLYNVSC